MTAWQELDMRGGTKSWLHTIRTDFDNWFWNQRGWIVATLAIFSAFSIPAIAEIVDRSIFIGLGVIAACLLAGFFSHYFAALDLVGGAIVAPWLCLIGFNWLSRQGPVGDLHFGLWPGLLLATFLFAVAAFGYLYIWNERKFALVAVPVVLAFANVWGLPSLLVRVDRQESDVTPPQELVSNIDLAIVVPKPQAEPSPIYRGDRTDESWNRQWSVGRLRGDDVSWLLLNSPDEAAARTAARGATAPVIGTPAWRDKADHVVLLDVDGTPPVTLDPVHLPSVKGTPGEIDRWLGIAARAAPGAQVAVLLQTNDQRRIDAWTRKVERRGGSVGTAQDLETKSLTEAAKVLAVQSSHATKDLQLATKYRPVLLFDSGEKQDTPYDIDSFLQAGLVRLCHDDKPDCDHEPPIHSAAELVNGRTHLGIREPGKNDPPVNTAIYVHPSDHAIKGRKLLYLDYWWYLPANPARVGEGASCGIGLAIPGKTCFDHPSDWEGMTVVLDRNNGKPVPVAVQYAQHKHVVRYDYARLQAYWKAVREGTKQIPGLKRQVLDNLKVIDDVDGRPPAFVARGTHATYAVPCPPLRKGKPCRELVDAAAPENHHDGFKSWVRNETVPCLRTACLQLLPTRDRGRQPALWNAYDGLWGDQKCILSGTYCNVERSPSSPGGQPRYKNPVAIAAYVDDPEGKPTRCGPGAKSCPDLPAPGN